MQKIVDFPCHSEKLVKGGNDEKKFLNFTNYAARDVSYAKFINPISNQRD